MVHLLIGGPLVLNVWLGLAGVSSFIQCMLPSASDLGMVLKNQSVIRPNGTFFTTLQKEKAFFWGGGHSCLRLQLKAFLTAFKALKLCLSPLAANLDEASHMASGKQCWETFHK